MEEIIYIADPKILAIPIVEGHDPLINLKDYQTLQYGEPPECELTKDCYTKIRKSVFEKLCKAQESLPDGWRFRLYEGFRSKLVQDHDFINYPNEWWHFSYGDRYWAYHQSVKEAMYSSADELVSKP